MKDSVPENPLQKYFTDVKYWLYDTCLVCVLQVMPCVIFPDKCVSILDIDT